MTLGPLGYGDWSLSRPGRMMLANDIQHGLIDQGSFLVDRQTGQRGCHAPSAWSDTMSSRWHLLITFGY